MTRKKLSLEQMVEFVRKVAEAALAEKRPIDAGCLVQGADGRLAVLMTPGVRAEGEGAEDLASAIGEFLEEHGVVNYCFMTQMNRRTRNIFIFAADREGERIARRLKVAKGQITELPHEEFHRFLELFPRTLH